MEEKPRNKEERYGDQYESGKAGKVRLSGFVRRMSTTANIGFCRKADKNEGLGGQICYRYESHHPYNQSTL